SSFILFSFYATASSELYALSLHDALPIFTPRGLSTGFLPHKNGHFQLDLDLTSHVLQIITSIDESREFSLPGLSVAQFYKKLFRHLEELKIEVEIYTKPVELENPIRFEEDHLHHTYDLDQVFALHLAMLSMHEEFFRMRCGFKGKGSDVHFFWGSFDLAVSLFSGRKAPKHPGGIPNLPDWVAEEAYSHEVMSFGFWPGSKALPEAAFYAYIYPEPEGFKNASIFPEEAYYHKELREFVLPYQAIRVSGDPSGKLREVLD